MQCAFRAEKILMNISQKFKTVKKPKVVSNLTIFFPWADTWRYDGLYFCGIIDQTMILRCGGVYKQKYSYKKQLIYPYN